MTHGEYDQINPVMYPWRVAEIVGNDGWLIFSNPDTFRRGYRTCWAPGERMVRVLYDQPSNFSINKDIVDVQNGRVYQSGFEATATTRGSGKPGTWDDYCFGRRVTLRGSYSNDTIQGTDRADVIFAYAGADNVFSGGGNDRVCGRWGPDLILNGGGGYDRIDGGGEGALLCFAEVARRC